MDNFKSYTKSKIVIYRAMPMNAPSSFRKDDYVTKSEKFAKEHAETSAIYNGEDYKVIKGIVNVQDIKPASNPGEYLMNIDVSGSDVLHLKLDQEYQTVDITRKAY